MVISRASGTSDPSSSSSLIQSAWFHSLHTNAFRKGLYIVNTIKHANKELGWEILPHTPKENIHLLITTIFDPILTI